MTDNPAVKALEQVIYRKGWEMSTKENAYTIADLTEIQEVAGAANTLRLQADRIEELEADNARLRDLLHDIDKATIWESGGTVPDRSMQGRVDAALDVMGKENSTVEKMRRVIVESPYAGDVEANVEYARAALYDCLMRGEAPFASHLLYTQPGVLDDSIPDERLDGIYAGLAWADVADAVVVYTDRGISDGMQYGITRHKESGRTVEYRSLADTGNKYGLDY